LRAFPLGIRKSASGSRLWALGFWVPRAYSREPKAGFVYSYPIDPLGYLHGFDNKRVKIAIERVKLAVGGAK